VTNRASFQTKVYFVLSCASSNISFHDTISLTLMGIPLTLTLKTTQSLENAGDHQKRKCRRVQYPPLAPFPLHYLILLKPLSCTRNSSHKHLRVRLRRPSPLLPKVRCSRHCLLCVITLQTSSIRKETNISRESSMIRATRRWPPMACH
jgi:hypothetical protein